MRQGIFGMLSRKSGGKVPNRTVSAAVYVFITLTVVSILLLMFSGGDFLLNVKNIGMSLFSGVRGGIHEVTSFVSRTVFSVGELADLRREHTELLRTLERFEELQRSNAEIIQENIRLREQLDFAQTTPFRRIPAQISGRDPNNLFSSIVINRGSFSGVSHNMAVVAWQNGTQSLVGRVIQVAAFESLVMPVFDNSSLVASRLSTSRFEGITEGQGSVNTPLLMRFVPQHALDEIDIGDIVISSGMGGIIPAGINIGRVSRIYSPRHETTLEIEVVPMVDFSRLEYIFVIEPDVIFAEAEILDG